MADEVTFDIEANDRASKVINKVQGEMDGMTDAATQWEQSLGKTNAKTQRSTGALGGMLGKVGKVAGGIGVATVAVNKIGDALFSLDEAASEVSTGFNMLEQSIANTTGSAETAEKMIGKMRGEIEGLSSQAGMRIPKVTEAARQLTFRLDDAGRASANLNRVVGVMALTGEEAESASKDLAEALNGELGALKELGLLSEKQIKKFDKLGARSERVAAAMEVVDQKIAGVTERNKENLSATERTSQAWERLTASLGASALVQAPLSLVVGLTESAASAAEDFRRGPPKVRRSLSANSGAKRSQRCAGKPGPSASGRVGSSGHGRTSASSRSTSKRNCASPRSKKPAGSWRKPHARRSTARSEFSSCSNRS